jgi:hypothetical protein
MITTCGTLIKTTNSVTSNRVHLYENTLHSRRPYSGEVPPGTLGYIQSLEPMDLSRYLTRNAFGCYLFLFTSSRGKPLTKPRTLFGYFNHYEITDDLTTQEVEIIKPHIPDEVFKFLGPFYTLQMFAKSHTTPPPSSDLKVIRIKK